MSIPDYINEPIRTGDTVRTCNTETVYRWMSGL